MYSNNVITAPISVSDPYYVMGVGQYNGVYNVAYICGNTHGKINRWAKHKPVIYNSPEELTDAQNVFANFGFDMNYAEDINITNLFTKSQDNPGWVYLPPVKDINWSRLTDFVLYNHNAKEPYDYSSFPTIINTSANTTSLQFRILKNSLAEIDITKFAYFTGANQNFKYAIACRKKGTTDIYIYYGDTISDAGNEILITVDFRSTGVWELLFIATRETTNEPANIGSVYMPNGYHTVEVKKVITYGQITITSVYNLELTYDGIIRGLHPIDITVKAVNSSLAQTTARILINVFCYNSSDQMVGSFTVDDESANFTYSGTAQKTYSLDFLYGSPIAISAYAPGIFIEEVQRVEIVADVKTVSGVDSMIFDKEYKWNVSK